ncbi:MAG TPA: hypothetical protein VFF30_20175 [Nitrososphaerales archaeon]|nr:hypothetical protein [Nitrososphaerales archaeon]
MRRIQRQVLSQNAAIISGADIDEKLGSDPTWIRASACGHVILM